MSSTFVYAQAILSIYNSQSPVDTAYEMHRSFQGCDYQDEETLFNMQVEVVKKTQQSPSRDSSNRIQKLKI